MNEQQRLRRHISAVQFAMWELHLYLDSHPYCKEAAKKLAAYREEYDKLTVEYEKAYGPLNETSRNICASSDSVTLCRCFPWR